MSDHEGGSQGGNLVGGADAAPVRDLPKGRLVTIDEFYTPDPAEPARAWHNFVAHFAGGMFGDSHRSKKYYQEFAAEYPDLAAKLCDAVQEMRKQKVNHLAQIKSDSQLRQMVYDAYAIMKRHGANDQELFGFGFETLKD